MCHRCLEHLLVTQVLDYTSTRGFQNALFEVPSNMLGSLGRGEAQDCDPHSTLLPPFRVEKPPLPSTALQR
jgi:hypothetical protein